MTADYVMELSVNVEGSDEDMIIELLSQKLTYGTFTCPRRTINCND